MQNSKNKIAKAKAYLSALGRIDSRSQFGGYSLSVESVVFALVSEGELYLRACNEAKPYIIQRQMKPLLFSRRGIPVELDYYRVDEPLWQHPEQLLALSQLCLQGAAQQRDMRKKNCRLKDLPNLSVRLEIQLRRAGIFTVEMLKQQGARRCWLRLYATNKNLSVNVLLALHGAIQGLHYAVLPRAIKEELYGWCNATKRYQQGSALHKH